MYSDSWGIREISILLIDPDLVNSNVKAAIMIAVSE